MNKPSIAMVSAGKATLRQALRQDATRVKTAPGAVIREIYRTVESERMKDEKRARQEASARRQRHNTPWDTPTAA